MMQPEDYKPYILQRELYIAVCQNIPPQNIGQWLCFTIRGRQYPIEPLAGSKAKDYRKRFNQLDRAVKAMLGRTGNNDPIDITVQFPTGEEEVIQIHPTPEQDEAERRQWTKKLAGTDAGGILSFDELLMLDYEKRNPQPQPQPQAPQRSEARQSRTSCGDSRNSRPAPKPKSGRK